MPPDFDSPLAVPPARTILHYHGDAVRAIFVVAALIIVFAACVSSAPPVAGIGAAVTAIVLIVAAGITNPAQAWIHWADAGLAAAGAIFFGSQTLELYQAGPATLNISFIFPLALALMSLVALYLATRTISGMMLREPRA